MIDPLEASLRHLAAHSALAALVEGRITAKTKYGMEVNGWAVGSAALTADIMPATADLYAGTLPFRLGIRCWGNDQQDAMQVWHALYSVVDATERTVVTLSNGAQALLYYLVVETMGELEFDESIKMDFVYAVVRGAVHSAALNEE